LCCAEKKKKSKANVIVKHLKIVAAAAVMAQGSIRKDVDVGAHLSKFDSTKEENSGGRETLFDVL
jgi:hypothetical protein